MVGGVIDLGPVGIMVGNTCWRKAAYCTVRKQREDQALFPVSSQALIPNFHPAKVPPLPIASQAHGQASKAAFRRSKLGEASTQFTILHAGE